MDIEQHEEPKPEVINHGHKVLFKFTDDISGEQVAVTASIWFANKEKLTIDNISSINFSPEGKLQGNTSLENLENRRAAFVFIRSKVGDNQICEYNPSHITPNRFINPKQDVAIKDIGGYKVKVTNEMIINDPEKGHGAKVTITLVSENRDSKTIPPQTITGYLNSQQVPKTSSDPLEPVAIAS